jgi:hypothetical protein
MFILSKTQRIMWCWHTFLYSISVNSSLVSLFWRHHHMTSSLLLHDTVSENVRKMYSLAAKIRPLFSLSMTSSLTSSPKSQPNQISQSTTSPPRINFQSTDTLPVMSFSETVILFFCKTHHQFMTDVFFLDTRWPLISHSTPLSWKCL